MNEPPHLTSLQNPRLKAMALRRRRSGRVVGSATILVEGAAEIRLAIEAGRVPQTLFYAPDLTRQGDEVTILTGLPPVVERVSLSAAAFAKIAYRRSPDGWLAEFASPVRGLDDLEIAPGALVVVAEGIEKPGNLGALVRTADAAGATAVVSASGVTDWLNPNVVRSSKGTVMTVPVAEASTDKVVSWIRSLRLRLIVATPDAPTRYTDADLTGPVALAVGAEHAGVSEALREAADELVAMPMLGRVDSLNAATAAALLVYESVRQRRG